MAEKAAGGVAFPLRLRHSRVVSERDFDRTVGRYCGDGAGRLEPGLNRSGESAGDTCLLGVDQERMRPVFGIVCVFCAL